MTPRVFEAVTTFSEEGRREYGRRMVDSFHQFWPAEVSLRVYADADLPAWLHDFKTKYAADRTAHGQGAQGRSMARYNYRFDAVRFAHKTAAVIDVIETSEADVLIWVDADTVTHAPVTLDFLRELAPVTGTSTVSWLWRSKTYPECGFYMLNLRDPWARRLAAEWKALYTEGRLFHLPEWHDSYVLAVLVKTLGISWRSLSGAAADTSHPFVNGPLGAVMDHMKGSRKIEGRSRQRDLVAPRDEAYWKGMR